MFILSTLLLPGGFAFLPFLWLVNVVWFFQEAFIKPTYTEQLQIKKCKHQKQSCLHIILIMKKYVWLYLSYLSLFIYLLCPYVCGIFKRLANNNSAGINKMLKQNEKKHFLWQIIIVSLIERLTNLTLIF